ncbi:FUSC family protein [Nocardia puris]|uniref:FUSC family protein n=1 Tax=Nocardia puris TaxID=208602 RepID=UPI0009FE98BF
MRCWPRCAGRITRGIHRILGTFAGLLVTAALLLPNPSPGALAVLVMVLLSPTELFMTRNYALSLGFFTPLIMLMTDLAAPAEPMTMLTERGVDTLIGVSAGIAVAVLVRRSRTSRTDDDVSAPTPGVEARSGRG